jgi:molybdenum cofactor biosynthesis enzyme MoaA
MLCSYPYKQVALKDWDGDKLKWSHPCCNMSRPEWEDPMGMHDIDKLTPPEIFESEQFKLLRDDFDNNRKNDFCKTCWNMEERNIEPFYIHNDDIIPKGQLDSIDFTLSNKCNLACRMCDPQTSHRLMVDWKFFKSQGLIKDIENITAGKFREELNIPNVKNSIQYKWLLNNPVKELRFSGGEPFFDSLIIDLLDKYIKEGWAKDTILAYHTNGTLFNDELIGKLNQFKKQFPKISIDSIEEGYDYIRHPASFDDLDRTVRLFLNNSTNLGRINIAVVISALNILDLHNHWSWCCTLPKKVFISYCEVYPDNRGISPKNLSRSLLNELPFIDSRKHQQILQSYKIRNVEKKDLVKREIELFDMSRSQSYKDYLHPHLVSWLES